MKPIAGGKKSHGERKAATNSFMMIIIGNHNKLPKNQEQIFSLLEIFPLELDKFLNLIL